MDTSREYQAIRNRLLSTIFTEKQNEKQNSELHTFNKRYGFNGINK